MGHTHPCGAHIPAGHIPAGHGVWGTAGGCGAVLLQSPRAPFPARPAAWGPAPHKAALQEQRGPRRPLPGLLLQPLAPGPALQEGASRAPRQQLRAPPAHTHAHGHSHVEVCAARARCHLPGTQAKAPLVSRVSPCTRTRVCTEHMGRELTPGDVSAPGAGTPRRAWSLLQFPVATAGP